MPTLVNLSCLSLLTLSARASRIFSLRPVELGELANEGWQVGFMVLAVEPMGMPTLESSFHRVGKEILIHADLYADSTNYLVVGEFIF
jgi:hypothetical protein